MKGERYDVPFMYGKNVPNVLVQVFIALAPRDFAACRMVCKEWRAVIDRHILGNRRTAKIRESWIEWYLQQNEELVRASVAGQVERVASLLCQYGIDPNSGMADKGTDYRRTDGLSTDKRTALWAASSRGHVQVVELLLSQSSVDVNKGTSDNERTALWTACYYGHERVVAALLAHPDIDVNKSTTHHGVTPLWAAACEGHTAIVGMLLRHAGIDVSRGALGLHGVSALVAASQRGHSDVVRVLRAHPEIVVNIGTTALWDLRKCDDLIRSRHTRHF